MGFGTMTGAARATVLLGAALVVGGAGAALAAQPSKIDPGRAAVVQSLSDCRKITEDASRLACYDKAASALDQAESQGQVVVIDREQARAVRRQAFGFNLPSLNLFSRGAVKTEEGLDHLNLNIASVHHSSEGKWVFVATDGAVWRQTDSEELAEDPHSGSKLFVHGGALGSFFCKVDGQPQVRCERVS
jgi:hypothetical protein